MRLILAVVALLGCTIPTLALECDYASVAGDKATYTNSDGLWELRVVWADYTAGSHKMPVAPETCPLSTAGTGMTQAHADCPNIGGQLVGFRALPKRRLPEVMAFYGMVWFGTCKSK